MNNKIKSEIELFADDFKLFDWTLSKEAIHNDLNKLSHCEDIWKLRDNSKKGSKIWSWI